MIHSVYYTLTMIHIDYDTLTMVHTDYDARLLRYTTYYTSCTVNPDIEIITELIYEMFRGLSSGS